MSLRLADLRRWLLIGCAGLAAGSAATAAGQSPLLSYAAEQTFETSVQEGALRSRVAALSFEIRTDPAPPSDCARTLGAQRFAATFDDLGAARSQLGEASEAAEAFSHAIACNPRGSQLYLELAQELLRLGRYEDARGAVRHSMELRSIPGESAARVESLLGEIDFLKGRWLDSLQHFRVAAIQADNDDEALYWQCFIWLTQKRDGTREPVLVERAPGIGWPRPVLETLKGKTTEADLVKVVAAQRDPERRRRFLAEALFYAGELHLLAAERVESVRYFAQTQRLHDVDLIEDTLALGELRNLRQ